MSTLPPYSYRGARAMVILHEQHLRAFLPVWKKAKKLKSPLPKTKDTDYASYDHLLHHVLRAARGYITWMCEKLELPDPGIPLAPEADVVAKQAEAFLDLVLEKWRKPLANTEESKFYVMHKSRWGMDYCVDSMLEHAVVHPIRHIFQLEELMGAATKKELTDYKYRGNRALILLHEKYLRGALATWRIAKAAGVVLPSPASRKAYESMEELLRHILGVPKFYMQGMCNWLKLPDPGIVYVPEAQQIEAEADRYINHVLEKWRPPLARISEKKSCDGYPTFHDMIYSVDSMLEHAVMHPIRHKFQLEELLEKR